MTWIPIIWSATATACITLGGLHLLVWRRRREAWGSLLFALLAFATATMAGFEYLMMRAQSPEEYGWILRLVHVPILVLIFALVAFVILHMRAGRPWLAWTICGLRSLSLALNFTTGVNLNYREITALRHVEFLGEPIPLPVGIQNHWMFLGQACLLLTIVFTIDAAVTVYRRGSRRQALDLAIAIILFTLAASSQSILALWGVWDAPPIPSIFFLGVVAVMGLDLSRGVLRAAELAGELRESEQRVVLAVEAGGVGLWVLDLPQRRVWVTEQTRGLFGLSGGDCLGLDEFLAFVHPDDRDCIALAIDRLVQSREGGTVECRVCHPNGDTRWLVIRGNIHPNETESAHRLIGTVVDVTDRVRAAEAIRASEEKYRKLFTEMTSGFILQSVVRNEAGEAVDLMGLAANRASEALLELAPGTIAGQRASAYVSPEELGKWLAILEPVARTGQSSRHEFYSERCHKHFAGIAYSPEPGTCALAFDDITQRKELEARLEASLEEVQLLRDRLQHENIYLREQIRGEDSQGAIVGRSAAILGVISQVAQVAPTDSHVLITGETGTGKELVAQAIHTMSKRNDGILVKVNCATLPSSLIESELFGREKGAFTGALTRQVGRFELADKGTIFLDEVGEMSLELQAKLLRVLQEGEFERLGGPRTIRVDARVIAATNRDLKNAVRQGSFRKDLYYRLCVFPIEVPPLRARTEDIPLLVWAFIDEFSLKMGKKIESISQKTMTQLQQHAWPGNVRELRNMIERAMIMSPGNRLEVPFPQQAESGTEVLPTMQSMERQHIIDALTQAGGHVKGPQGAAALLGLKPSTLYSKMHKLGIRNHSARVDISS